MEQDFPINVRDKHFSFSQCQNQRHNRVISSPENHQWHASFVKWQRHVEKHMSAWYHQWSGRRQGMLGFRVTKLSGSDWVHIYNSADPAEGWMQNSNLNLYNRKRPQGSQLAPFQFKGMQYILFIINATAFRTVRNRSQKRTVINFKHLDYYAQIECALRLLPVCASTRPCQ